MAREYQTVNFRINLSKLAPAHYWTNPANGEVHADFKMMLDLKGEKKTYEGKEYMDHGFVAQLVSGETWKAEKDKPNAEKTSLPILGSVRIWQKGGGGSPASMPGYTGAETAAPAATGGVPGLSGPVGTGSPVVKEKLPF